MVDVVTGVPGGQILEQTTVHSKDVVSMGPKLLAVTEHAPRLAVSLPQNLDKKKRLPHTLYSLHRHRCSGRLVTFVAIQKIQVCAEISGNKEIHTSGTVADCRHFALQGVGVARRKVTTHHVQALYACHQLVADEVRDVLLVGLHH